MYTKYILRKICIHRINYVNIYIYILKIENNICEKKNITFSTRWMKTMDNAINDLSDVMMISKHSYMGIFSW